MTFHMAHNYGAMLQAYALATVLNKIGVGGEVIDYRFQYIDKWGRVKYLNDLINESGFIKGALRYFNRIIRGYYNPNRMRNKFSYFERNLISHSKQIYANRKQLNTLEYDAIVFGSDQIWNSNLTNGPAGEYVGDFITVNGVKKIAYAASCGTNDFNDDCREYYKKCLKDFYAIGVREKSFAETLKKYGFDAVTVLDPTLLLKKEEWLSMVRSVSNVMSISSKYILVYAFDEDEKLYEYAKNIAKERNLRVVAIAYTKKACMKDIEVLTNCGPADFINLMANAEMVITTSFHGTAFSIIMQKDFYCIPHPKYRERTDSLLALLNLDERNTENLCDLGKAEAINWDEVYVLLENERNKSYEFLIKSLS